MDALDEEDERARLSSMSDWGAALRAASRSGAADAALSLAVQQQHRLAHVSACTISACARGSSVESLSVAVRELGPDRALVLACKLGNDAATDVLSRIASPDAISRSGRICLIAGHAACGERLACASEGASLSLLSNTLLTFIESEAFRRLDHIRMACSWMRRTSESPRFESSLASAGRHLVYPALSTLNIQIINAPGPVSEYHDREWFTCPLSREAAAGKEDVVRMLLGMGADPLFSTDRQDSPLGIAMAGRFSFEIARAIAENALFAPVVRADDSDAPDLVAAAFIFGMTPEWRTLGISDWTDAATRSGRSGKSVLLRLVEAAERIPQSRDHIQRGIEMLGARCPSAFSQRCGKYHPMHMLRTLRFYADIPAATYAHIPPYEWYELVGDEIVFRVYHWQGPYLVSADAIDCDAVERLQREGRLDEALFELDEEQEDGGPVFVSILEAALLFDFHDALSRCVQAGANLSGAIRRMMVAPHTVQTETAVCFFSGVSPRSDAQLRDLLLCAVLVHDDAVVALRERVGHDKFLQAATGERASDNVLWRMLERHESMLQFEFNRALACLSRFAPGLCVAAGTSGGRTFPEAARDELGYFSPIRCMFAS